MTVMPVFPGKGGLVIKNMRETRFNGMSGNMSLPQACHWFCQNMRNGGTWGYKQKSCDLANLGNFHYGATGIAAGIPEIILFMNVGFAQSCVKTGSAWYEKFPYGDDSRDQFWIKQGIDDARQHGD